MLSLLLVARKIFASSSPQAKIHRPKAPAVEWSARLFFSRKFLRFQRVLELFVEREGSRSPVVRTERERAAAGGASSVDNNWHWSQRRVAISSRSERERAAAAGGGSRQLLTIGTGRNDEEDGRFLVVGSSF
jgi:hypothetical protein